MNRENQINITQRHSRDHRPDLTQSILDLLVSSDGDIPLFFRGASGNKSQIKQYLLKSWWSMTNTEILKV
jgi:transposase